jgi:hypothetical protein
MSLNKFFWRQQHWRLISNYNHFYYWEKKTNRMNDIIVQLRKRQKFWYIYNRIRLKKDKLTATNVECSTWCKLRSSLYVTYRIRFHNHIEMKWSAYAAIDRQIHTRTHSYNWLAFLTCYVLYPAVKRKKATSNHISVHHSVYRRFYPK